MELISIISQLEKEADLADDKMAESDSQYYDGYGNGLRYAIDILKEYALNDCNQRIAELEFAKIQNLQHSFMLSRLHASRIMNYRKE